MNLETSGFYNIKTITVDTDKVSATVVLNKDHQIFQGHFPERPIVPGVCQMQMIREVVEKALNERYFLAESKQIKFLTFVNPLEVTELHLDVTYKNEDQSLIFSATIRNESLTDCLKINGVYKKQTDQKIC